MTKEDRKQWFQGIVAEVKENQRRLDECLGPHDFRPADAGCLLTKYCCSKCGGTVDAIQFQWYRRGLEHGKVMNAY